MESRTGYVKRMQEKNKRLNRKANKWHLKALGSHVEKRDNFVGFFLLGKFVGHIQKRKQNLAMMNPQKGWYFLTPEKWE